MNDTPIVFTSKYLRTTRQSAPVARALSATLSSIGIEHRELQNTVDFWCRDYMPLRLFDHSSTYVGYRYCPDYLFDDERNRQYITNQEDAVVGVPVEIQNNLDIVFDGGNYVRCGDKAIVCDKIFSENPNLEVEQMIHDLKVKLKAELVFLPWDMEEICGHADGMVSYLGDGKILLNNYGQLLKKTDLSYLKRLVKILEPHFEIVELSYNCKVDPDSWCYLNYLCYGNHLLLPCLSENADCDNDMAAIEVFRKLFPGKSIHPVYARPIVKFGGALHCVTWELFE